MIKAIFFARFHSREGPVVKHQVPAGAVVHFQQHNDIHEDKQEPEPTTKPLLDWPLVSPYLVPPQSLCNRLLTLRSPTSRNLVVSHPVCIVDDTRYDRNEFIFNFGFVLSHKELGQRHGMVEAWKKIVRKIANVLRDLELETQWLSRDEEALDSGKMTRLDSRVYALCEMVMEDLNCFGDSMIPIDDTTTLSLRLFPRPRTPLPARPWHVPVLLVNTAALDTSSWDLVLQHLLPYIDGVNYVSRIAQLADADLDLACEAIQALVHNGCALLLDIFSFSASYAPTPQIVRLVEDEVAQEEAREYVRLPGYDKQDWYKEDVVKLLCSLKQGARLREWILDRPEQLAGIDVRRLITFGVTRGYLYRVHKYGVRLGHTVKASESADSPDRKFRPYLDGQHPFDEISTGLFLNDEESTAAIKGQDTILIHR